MYNEWASKNRFQIGDAIRFKYKKDSVMAVSDSDYKRCNSTYPIFFSNNGNTLYRLDHSGLFYFISGASGHCERGQKMIIKVMSPEDSEGRDEPNSSDVAAPVAGASTLVILQLVLSFLGFHLL
ncbi:PREDICTED: early nodulin-like protein 1 [Nelumbo nucifera]|nr:PREDICTED: early nodulin-like protein 1 [Nelumbo nucifera]